MPHPANADPPAPDTAGDAKGAAPAFMPGPAPRRAAPMPGGAGGLDGEMPDSGLPAPTEPRLSLPSCSQPGTRIFTELSLTL